MSTATTKRQLLAGTGFAEAIAAASATGEPAAKVQLMPIGDINARDGRKWRVRDAVHAQAIVDASKVTAGGTDLPIDYDHQLVFGAKDGVGGQAPAAGWMKNLRVEADGIWADVDWTAAATARLAAREYRYISPYFGFDKVSGDVSRIYHAGLVNFPAITELAAVASADPSGDSMDLTKLAALFGLAATATLDEIVAAATADKAAAAAALEAATTAAVDPTKYAPISELAAANARLLALETAAATTAATSAVDAAVAAGKVTPANRDWALGYAAKDLAGFSAFVGAAPVVVSADARGAASAKNPEEITSLTPEQKAVCVATGCSEAAFLKTLKEEAAHGRA